MRSEDCTIAPAPTRTLLSIPVECQNGHAATWRVEVVGLEHRDLGVDPAEKCDCPKHALGEGYHATGAVQVEAATLPRIPMGPKHTGMRISMSGLLGRLRDGGQLTGDQRYVLGELLRHLEMVAERYYSGDVVAVDEFLQLYCLAEGRP